MAKIDNKSYDKMITKIEAMADGAKIHKGNAKIAASVVESEHRQNKSDLEAARQAYLNLETDTRKAYDAFAAKYKEVNAKVAADSLIVKGVVGRTSEDLKAFGISPEKVRSTKKANAKVKV